MPSRRASTRERRVSRPFDRRCRLRCGPMPRPLDHPAQHVPRRPRRAGAIRRGDISTMCAGARTAQGVAASRPRRPPPITTPTGCPVATARRRPPGWHRGRRRCGRRGSRQVVSRDGRHEGVGAGGQHEGVVGDAAAEGSSWTCLADRSIPGDPVPEDQFDQFVAGVPFPGSPSRARSQCSV